MSSATPQIRMSARDWLLRMPEILSVGELALLMGRSRIEASNYLWRWRSANLVKALGGKSGIFLNLVLNPKAASDGALWERAVLKAMPSAVVAGHQVLADSGLSTQVTHQRYLIVSNTDSDFEIDGAEVHRRPIPWLKRLAREGAVDMDSPGLLLPRLKPGAALADLALYGAQKPDPDDLDMDMIEPEEVQRFYQLARESDLAEQLPAPVKSPRRRPRP